MKIVNPLAIQFRLEKYKERLTEDQIIMLLLSQNTRQFRKRLHLMLNGPTIKPITHERKTKRKRLFHT
jgi:hypothetical protein